jgi:hypothetical protein
MNAPAPTNHSSEHPPSAKWQAHKIVWFICLLAAIHVFIFSAAFPFFNNVDEPAQFDLALDYAGGHIPRGLEKFSADGSFYLTFYSSCAFMGMPDAFPGHQMPPPLWTEPKAKMQQDFALISATWCTQTNYEVSQAPLYYALAGGWWHAGGWLGFHNGRQLYWLRFLNIVLVMTMIWIGYWTARLVFPENSFICLGLPLVLAFMPQTAFYSIGNDPLSAVWFGAVFLCALKWLLSPKVSPAIGALMGLAFAASYLTKMTNLPLLMIAGAAITMRIVRRPNTESFRSTLPSLAAFLICAVPPMIAWTIWCKAYFGDDTGAKLKMDHFGWTIKPFAEWWHHPIFSPQGIWTYFSGQMGTFWQGEFTWHYFTMILPGTNAIYATLSLILVAAGLPALFSKSSNITPAQRQALGWSLACFLGALLFFAWLSIIYDFHDCPNPSRADPYFHAGRMILGVLIPFLLLFVYGLDRMFNRFGGIAKFSALGVMLLAMLALEITTDWRVFPNDYNWFHLP